jgi:hypothetical protein
LYGAGEMEGANQDTPTSMHFLKPEKSCDIIGSSSQASGNAFCYLFEHLTSPKFL